MNLFLDTNSMEFRCIACDKCFKMKMCLSNHMRLIHGNPRQYPCTQCEYTSRIKRDCEMHIRSIHEKIKDICMVCEKQYSNRHNLNRHRKKHHLHLQNLKRNKKKTDDVEAD